MKFLKELKKKNTHLKNWLIKNIAVDMLWHYIFGVWAALLGMFFDDRAIGITASVFLVAILKEFYDLFDYGLFSLKDIIFTLLGGATVYFFTHLHDYV